MKREFPPYNGIGSDEDSLSSCLYLIPKPPRKDFERFMDKDRWVWLLTPPFSHLNVHTSRQGLDSNILRFVAQLETTRPIDMDRRFIIFYYLADGTIAVYEPPQRNSGQARVVAEPSLLITHCHRDYRWKVSRAEQATESMQHGGKVPNPVPNLLSSRGSLLRWDFGVVQA